MSVRASTWRRVLRWVGVSHEGPIRVRAKHWWEWRRANRVERYLNWKNAQPEFQAELQRRLMESLLDGSAFANSCPDGFYGLGIGDLLEAHGTKH